MDCRTAVEAILELRVGTLAPAARRALEEHAASCARCRAESALAAAIETALVTVDGPHPGEDFAARVLARLRAADRPRSDAMRAPAWPVRMLVRLAPAGAIAATIAGIAVIGPTVGGALVDFFARPLPQLTPAIWMSIIAGAGLATAGAYQAVSFFAES